MNLKMLLGILLKRSSKNFVHKTLIIIIVNTFNCYSQNITSIINSDFIIINQTFNKQLFLDKSHGDYYSFFEILSIDTMHLYLKGKNIEDISPVRVIHVEVKLKEELINRNQNKNAQFSGTLSYYLISTVNSNYRLFGFYNTDIRLFLERTDKAGLLSLCHSLVSLNVINKKESKAFVKSLKGRNRKYSEKINKPCVILEKYFEKKDICEANTIILPLKPLIPFYTN